MRSFKRNYETLPTRLEKLERTKAVLLALGYRLERRMSRDGVTEYLYRPDGTLAVLAQLPEGV